MGETISYDLFVEICTYLTQLDDLVSLRLVNKQLACWIFALRDNKLFECEIIKKLQPLLGLIFDTNPCEFFEEVCRNNLSIAIKLLLTDPRVDPSTNNNHTIRVASVNGHIEVVKLLLTDQRVNPSIYSDFVIQYASSDGNLEMVKLLLRDPRVNPSSCGNYAIRVASENGNTEVVKLLLTDSRVNPADSDNYAL